MKSVTLTGAVFHPRPSPPNHPVDLAANSGKSDRLLASPYGDETLACR